MTYKNDKTAMVGFVGWELRNADGTVARQGAGKNLVVDNGKLHPSRSANANYPVGRYLFIAEDEHDVVPFMNTLWRAVGTNSSFAGTTLDTGTGGWNRSTLTRTVSGTFLAPISTRTVTHIGLSYLNGGESNGVISQMFSALKIDPPIIQTTSQTLEVTYRVVVLPQTAKDIKRFPQTWRHLNRNWLERHLVDHTNSYVGWMMPWTFSKYHFIDEDAQMMCTFENNGHYRNTWHVTDGAFPAFTLQNSILGYYSDSHLIEASENTTQYNGAFGMMVTGENSGGTPSDATTLPTYTNGICMGYYPMAHDWGKYGPLVFPHPIARSFYFNEVAIDKTGQGDMELGDGIYIPNDAGDASPQHWAYNVLITDSGDTDAGTEGAYVFKRTTFYSYSFGHNASLRTGGTGTYTYVDNDGGSGNSAITQASGDFRNTDFFNVDCRLEISGTASNDGTTYKIIKVEPLKLTLEGVVLTNEGPVASSIQAIDLWRFSGNDDRLETNSNGTAGWKMGANHRHERTLAAEGTDSPRYNTYRLVFDGIDTYWGFQYRDTSDGEGTRYTAVRWRAMTGEQDFRGAPNPQNVAINADQNRDPFLDTTRFVRHVDGTPLGTQTSQPYGLATDGAGLTFVGIRDGNEVSADNKVFIIDNSKPGRWYQRPSGSIDGSGNFTVDADDQIHAMFPFVGGDAGATPKIRIVNSTEGNDGVYSITTFTNANEVVLSGSFSAESNMEWHWTTIDESEPAVGQLRGLVYDQNNGRLWALGSLGLKLSTDDGQTWGTLLDESTAVTPLIDSEARAEISVGSVDGGLGGYTVDNGGDLWWLSVDTGGSGQYWLNKLELNSGIGVDAVHSRIGLTVDFPNAGNRPASLNVLCWEKGVDNPNQRGALWITEQNTSSTDFSFYRMPIDAGAVSAAPQISKLQEFYQPSINGTTAGELDSLFHIITLPSGKTFLRDYNGSVGWYAYDPRYADNVANSLIDFGGNIYDDQVYCGSVQREQWRDDGCFWITFDNNEVGYFGSMRQLFRFAPAADVGGQSGAVASIVAGAPTGQVRVQGLTGMTADSVGRHLEITGAASSANNNTFIIAAQNSATEVDVFAPNGVTGDANNGSISWQEKESEWVQWEGSESQFNAWYGTVSGGRRPLHADEQELRDNIKVKFTQAGGATAPADEFVEGEQFTFIASFGEHKTNVEDIDINTYKGNLAVETKIETEDIKIATGSGSKNAYWRTSSSFTTPTPTIISTDIMDANGKNWGTVPYNYYTLYGLGVSVDSDPSASGRPSVYGGLDLGAATEIHKLVVEYGLGNSGFDNDSNFAHASQVSTQRIGEIHVYSAPDATTLPTEIDATLRWPADTYALGQHIYLWQEPGAHNFDTYIRYRITIDLAGAGLSVGQRTARFWEIGLGVNSGDSNRRNHLASIYALDASDEVIGITTDQYIDEKYDSDFAGMNLQQVFWIQNVHGGGDPGAGTVISTTDDGDGDGYTNTVTLDSGLFDTANIDITKDFLAWKEPGSPAVSGYLRATDRAGQVFPRALSDVTNANVSVRSPQLGQAMSRIIDTSTPGQIIVEDDIIPDNLSGVEWEVRRPAPTTTSRSSTDADAFYYCHTQGTFDHHPSNESASRRFRVTNKNIFKK